MRKAYCIIWVHPDDCDPPHGLDMLSDHDASKVDSLRKEFELNGFNKDYPALVGYPLKKRIQLLSGTHRHLAAKEANIKLPVTLWLRSDIESTWGTELWDTTISDIPVRELEAHYIEDGFKVSLYDQVSLEYDK